MKERPEGIFGRLEAAGAAGVGVWDCVASRRGEVALDDAVEGVLEA